MNDKLFDNNYRRLFIKNADFNTLNKYLKNMEKLSKKGGKYLEMYNTDIDYLLNNDIFESEPTSLNLFFDNNYSEMSVCGTEANINMIHKMADNVISKKISQQNMNNIFVKQINILEELHKIEQCLNIDNINNDSEHCRRTIKNAVRALIDIVMTSHNEYDQKVLEQYFKILSSLLKDNKVSIIEGYRYFGQKIKGKNNVIVVQFLKDLGNLKSKKENMDHYVYKQEKYNLIHNSYSTYGMENVLTSLLFNTIYSTYKKYNI